MRLDFAHNQTEIRPQFVSDRTAIGIWPPPAVAEDDADGNIASRFRLQSGRNLASIDCCQGWRWRQHCDRISVKIRSPPPTPSARAMLAVCGRGARAHFCQLDGWSHCTIDDRYAVAHERAPWSHKGDQNRVYIYTKLIFWMPTLVHPACDLDTVGADRISVWIRSRSDDVNAPRIQGLNYNSNHHRRRINRLPIDHHHHSAQSHT